MRGRQDLIGSSDELSSIRRMVTRLAHLSDPVLITGETGVGKEVVANAIHAAGPRRRGPFVPVNMGALAEGTLESELFGHERGAFTGAVAQRAGRFERAHGGTILLDEIGDAPPRVQAELLRVVEHGTVERLGGMRPIQVDARIIAATHRDLRDSISQSRFRADLWYRLSAFHVHIPPLRDRRADIRPLVLHELEEIAAGREGARFELEPSGFDFLEMQTWPGNARELRFAVRRMVFVAAGRTTLTERDARRALGTDFFPPEPVAGGGATEQGEPRLPASRAQFDQHERDEIVRALNAHRWNVSAAARALGVSRGALRTRIQRLGLRARSVPTDPGGGAR